MDQPLAPGQWGRLLATENSEQPQKTPLHAVILDWSFGLTGAALVLYTAGCRLGFLDEICAGDTPQLLAWLDIMGILLIARPIWSILAPKCPKSTLHRSCQVWPCCCGCAWVFPLFCVVSLSSVITGQILTSAIVFGVTDGVRGDDPTEVSFWSGLRDNIEAGQWSTLFLAFFFNAVVLYICIPLMLLSWFTPSRRGLLVTIVCVCLKWATFHQYSQIINALSLAFELTVPLILPETYLETVAGEGALYNVFGLIVALSLVQVLLYTYAHSPRGDPGGDESVDGSTDENGPFGSNSDRVGEDGRPQRNSKVWRRGSAAQIGYCRSDSASDFRLSLRVHVNRRAQQDAMIYANNPIRARCENRCCNSHTMNTVWQVAVPAIIVGFFICLYIGLFAPDSIVMTFITELPCIPGMGCPEFAPSANGCDEDPALGPIGEGEEYTACGRYRTTQAQLLQDIWRGEVGFQHTPFTCETDADCDERVGLPCNDGVCQAGPIIKTTNKVFNLLMTVGPIAVMPQFQVLLLAALWFIPMKVRTMANLLLATQMALAWSTLDVWVVMVKIRVDDLERYSLTAQQDLCEPIFPDGICFAALGTLPGYGLIMLACAAALQWVATCTISYKAAGVIVQWAKEEEEKEQARSEGGGLSESSLSAECTTRISTAPIPPVRETKITQAETVRSAAKW